MCCVGKDQVNIQDVDHFEFVEYGSRTLESEKRLHRVTRQIFVLRIWDQFILTINNATHAHLKQKYGTNHHSNGAEVVQGFNSPMILMGRVLHIIAQYLKVKHTLTLYKSMQCLRICIQNAHRTNNDISRPIPWRRRPRYFAEYRVC